MIYIMKIIIKTKIFELSFSAVLPPPLNPMAVFERDERYGVSGKSSISGSSLRHCHAFAFKDKTLKENKVETRTSRTDDSSFNISK